MHEIQDVTSDKVEEALDSISEESRGISESAKREVKRRSDAEEELASILPPDVVAILTQGDQAERDGENHHNTAHTKFVDVIKKFFTKFQAEETKFKDRMAELQDAMNPDAEATVLQRYKQTKARLQAELQDQLLTRTEQLDEDHSALEYARERSELLGLEAKVVLTNAAMLAGDYDATIPGVYGEDNIPSASSNKEIIPLLKQLLAMLERGAHFTLMLGGEGQGDTNININRGGATSPDLGRNIVRGDINLLNVSKSGDKVTSPLLQSSPDSDDRKLRDGKSKLQVQQGPGSMMTDAERTRLAKTLAEKHTIEIVNLENETSNDEIKDINAIIQDSEKKKEQGLKQMQKELREKLSRAKSDDERARIIAEYADQVQRLSEKLEKEKQEQLTRLRQQMRDRRKRRKEDLHRQQVAEAKREGLTEDNVPEMTNPTDDELDSDLRRLAESQEKLLAELQSQYAEDMQKAADAEERRDVLDADMEARMRALNAANKAKVAEAIEAVSQQSKRSKDLKNNMKERMKARRAKKKDKKLPDGVKPGSDEEKEYLEAADAQEDADRKREEQALLSVLDDIANEEQRKSHTDALNSLMQDGNVSQEERDRIMAEHEANQEKLKEKLDSQKDQQKNALMAKLAAKKRLRQEVKVEDAVHKELNHVSKQQVTTKALAGGEEGGKAIDDINASLESEEIKNKLKTLQENQIDRQAELEVKHLEDEEKIKRDIEADGEKANKEIDSEMDDEKKRLIAQRDAEFQKEMMLKRKQMGEEEYERLMEQHRLEMARLADNMEQEKMRQKKVLEDRLAERRKRQIASLKDKQEAEMGRELAKQQMEREQVLEKQMRGKERGAIQEEANEGGGSVEQMVYRVLRQRHLKETVNQEEQMKRDRAAAIAEARSKMADQRQTEREKLLAAQQQEIMDLLTNPGDMTEEELADRKEDLLRQHKKQLSDFDKITAQKIEQAEKDILPGLDVKHAHERLALKEKQLRELADAMRDMSLQKRNWSKSTLMRLTRPRQTPKGSEKPR
ncbi:golgin subfamily A member 6-like protein 25 isoform X1 [Ptychodera flava]|uniref:golgin subfamily A member 6-like protein 25 isoform X1 n=1 Tax=Ptychodera flava TaxID=63121 RepID=UPI003969F36B